MPQEEECKAIIIEASNRGNSCKFTGGHYVGYKGREQGDPGTWVTPSISRLAPRERPFITYPF
jgi:hypothetical protein